MGFPPIGARRVSWSGYNQFGYSVNRPILLSQSRDPLTLSNPIPNCRCRSYTKPTTSNPRYSPPRRR
ncbi:hypothetical protein LINGRAHAP2_LOCUS28171, partial [Linum grandiflorum]